MTEELPLFLSSGFGGLVDLTIWKVQGGSNIYCKSPPIPPLFPNICGIILASFPGPRPASRRLQYGKVTGSWARAWERG